MHSPRSRGLSLACLPVVLATLAALLAPQPSLAGGAGFWVVGETGLQVQNLDPAAVAGIRARFFDFDGRLTYDLGRRVGPGAATNFYLPKIEREAGLLPQAYALVITATRPVAAISRTEDRQAGAAVMYSNIEPGLQMVVPLALKGYAQQNTLVSVQNTDLAAPAQLRVSIFRSGNPIAVAELGRTLAPAGSGIVDLASDQDLASLPSGFLGWLLVLADRPVTVQASIHAATSDQAVAAFEGQHRGAAANRLHVPLVRHDYHGTTGIAVVNPATSGATEVTASFYGTLGSCAGQRYRQGPVSLPAATSAVFYQGAGDLPLTGRGPLPPGCAGVAEISASAGGVLATVLDQDRVDRPHTSAGFNAIPDSQGSRRVALPLVRNRHTPADLVTGIQAKNMDPAAPSTVTLEIIDSDGNRLPAGADQRVTLPPGGAHTFYLPSLTALATRSGLFGSAILDADRPLAVVAVEASLNDRSDSVAYNGMPAEPGGAGGEIPLRAAAVRGPGGAR